MKKMVMALSLIFSFSIFAAPALETGAYGVKVKDRHGTVHSCTLDIENVTDSQGNYLILNIADCPPKLVDIYLFPYDDGAVFVSDKISVTTRRGGTKFYEITPLTTNKFEMKSYREYGDGGVGKPRRVVATKK